MNSLNDIKKIIKEVFLEELGFYNHPKHKGDIVRIINPLEDEDPNMEYIVVEDPSIYGDYEGILVQALETGMSISPTSRIVKKDLEVVTPATTETNHIKDINEDNLDEERIANSDARKFVERKENFLGTHLFAENISGGKEGESGFVVCSYLQENPIFIYDEKLNKWYENSDEFIDPITGKIVDQVQTHRELVRPNVQMHTRSRGQMLKILKNIMDRNDVKELSHKSVYPGDK